MSNSIFYSVFFILLFSLFSSVLAQEKYEVNQNGEVRKVEQSPNQWRELTPVELEACQNPDKQILYGNVERIFKKADFWHYREIKIAHKSVRWSSDLKKFIYKTGDFAQSDERKFAWSIVFVFIALGLVIIFNFIIYNKVISGAFYFAIASAIAIAIAFTSAIASAIAIAIAFYFTIAIAIAFASAIASEEEKKKNIKISQKWLIVDYLLITAYLIFWFIL